MSYLVNKLETEVSSDLAGDFEAFSSVSFISFFTGHNCPQQLYIIETKTNNVCYNMPYFIVLS